MKTRMTLALSNDINSLSPAIQRIIIDDLVTALENRLKVFANKKSNLTFVPNVEEVDSLRVLA